MFLWAFRQWDQLVGVAPWGGSGQGCGLSSAGDQVAPGVSVRWPDLAHQIVVVLPLDHGVAVRARVAACRALAHQVGPSLEGIGPDLPVVLSLSLFAGRKTIDGGHS